MEKNTYQIIREKISQADAVLIGASNGLSISEGFNLFSDDSWFRENFGDFRSKYGVYSVLQGAFFPFPSQEEKWAFWSRLVYRKSIDVQPSRMMLDLYRMVEEKEYYILTSNGEDHFVPAGFAPERIFETEGSFTEMCCEQGCHNTAYPNHEEVKQMAEAERNGFVPTELLPKCPKCGGNMKIHMAADQSFFQTASWRRKQAEYQAFVQKQHHKKLVILELGVGWRNQLIKVPLIQLAATEPFATYVIFNKGEIYIPPEIVSKSIGVNSDIGTAITAIMG